MSEQTMTDDEYQRQRAVFQEAQTIKEGLEAEAIGRGEAFILHAWYYQVRVQWPYLTLEEALDRAADDCSPEYIVAPDGAHLDPFTGTPSEPSA